MSIYYMLGSIIDHCSLFLMLPSKLSMGTAAFADIWIGVVDIVIGAFQLNCATDLCFL